MNAESPSLHQGASLPDTISTGTGATLTVQGTTPWHLLRLPAEHGSLEQEELPIPRAAAGGWARGPFGGVQVGKRYCLVNICWVIASHLEYMSTLSLLSPRTKRDVHPPECRITASKSELSPAQGDSTEHSSSGKGSIKMGVSTTSEEQGHSPGGFQL